MKLACLPLPLILLFHPPLPSLLAPALGAGALSRRYYVTSTTEVRLYTVTTNISNVKFAML